jgi:hypothetical protein
MSSRLVSFEKTLSSQLKNTVVLNVIRVFLVIYILMITSIPVSMLRLFENVLFQIFYLSLLAYMALIDPASALLMAAAYLFTVQQLNQTMGMGVSSNNNVVKMMNNNTSMMMNNNAMMNNNKRENFTGPVANNTTMAPALAIASETHSEHPAFQTMTDNLSAAGSTFTSDLQFNDAQSNYVVDVDQTAGIKSWQNQFSAQGIDLPRGFDSDIYRGAQL